MRSLPKPIDVLPHRPPFLFLDAVSECSEVRVVATRTFGDEDFLAGHFPGNPLVPGVILIEAMAQALGYLALRERAATAILLTGVEACRIRRGVRPGETVRFEVEVTKTRLAMVVATGVGYVGDERAITATLKGYLQS